MKTTEEIITRDAAQLSALEFAIGSLGHSLHIPFVGHVLSLNEGAFLCHATVHSPNRWKASLHCYEIAGVSAAIKSLSPSLKKLGPMLSIVMQGALFSLGVLIGGRRYFGQILGMLLLSTWAFLQPLITLLATFGPQQLEQVSKFYLKKMESDYHIPGLTLFLVVMGFLLLKLLASGIIVLIVNRQQDSNWVQWLNYWGDKSLKLSSGSSTESKTPSTHPNLGKQIFKELLSPLFLFSFLMTGLFLFVQTESISEMIWQLLRPFGIAFVIIYLARSDYFFKFLNRVFSRFGFLTPIQKRLEKVRTYWETKDIS